MIRKFTVMISILFVALLFLNMNQSLALREFNEFELAKYTFEVDTEAEVKPNFEEVKRELINDFLKDFPNYVKNLSTPKQLKTEMIVCARIQAPLEQFNLNIPNAPEARYAISIQTVEGVPKSSVTDLTLEEINSIYKCGATIEDGRYIDIVDNYIWDVYFKVKCNVTYVGDNYILTVTATDISKDPSKISINPEDLVEPEHEEDPSLIESVKKIDDMFKDYGKDALRNT